MRKKVKKGGAEGWERGGCFNGIGVPLLINGKKYMAARAFRNIPINETPRLERGRF